MRSDVRHNRAGVAKRFALLAVQLLLFPLLGACASEGEKAEPCPRTKSCADKRPLPILY